MIFNILIMVLITIVFIAAVYYYIFKSRSKTIEEEMNILEKEAKNLSLDKLKQVILDMINAYTRDTLLDQGYSKEEYEKERNKRDRLKVSLDKCKYGSRSDKEIVKDYIYDMLYEVVGEFMIDEVILFNDPVKLSIQDKFEILLYIYKTKREFGSNALMQIMKEYNLDDLKNIIEDGQESYIITVEEIENIFQSLYTNYKLTTRDKLQIVTQRIYQEVKGLGVIDEIRDQNIDGVSGGVSGRVDVDADEITVKEFIEQYKSNRMNYDSVWIMFQGKSIHLSFLSFMSEGELIRVCRNIYRHNKPGELSENDGYIINDMADNSRVVVARPPFCESWVFFVRKFSRDIKNLGDIYKDEDTEGSWLVRGMMKHAIKGQLIQAVTGSQGVGKTTILKAMIKEIKPTLPLRINEMAFEVHGRDLYDGRNIVTFREWGSISGKEGLDLQKKTDGSVNILGEIATDEVAAMMVEMAQVASLFTLFTHHAKTAFNLVESIRNSLLKEDVFQNETIAIEQVINILDLDIHLTKDNNGKRYVERITEIIPMERIEYDSDFDNLSEFEAQKKMYKETLKYYSGKTGRQLFDDRNIIEYIDGKYVVTNLPSKPLIEKIKSVMNIKELQEFEEFMAKMKEA